MLYPILNFKVLKARMRTKEEYERLGSQEKYNIINPIHVGNFIISLSFILIYFICLLW